MPRDKEIHEKVHDTMIDDVLEMCDDNINEGVSMFDGLTYEEGVKAAIEWLLQGTEEHPMVY